jgi:hypothetical protein
MTTVVADTGDLGVVARLKSVDRTYTFGHSMIDVVAIRRTYLLSKIFGNANVLCF